MTRQQPNFGCCQQNGFGRLDQQSLLRIRCPKINLPYILILGFTGLVCLHQQTERDGPHNSFRVNSAITLTLRDTKTASCLPLHLAQWKWRNGISLWIQQQLSKSLNKQRRSIFGSGRRSVCGVPCHRSVDKLILVCWSLEDGRQPVCFFHGKDDQRGDPHDATQAYDGDYPHNGLLNLLRYCESTGCCGSRITQMWKVGCYPTNTTTQFTL
jgi:hypothetical protein